MASGQEGRVMSAHFWVFEGGDVREAAGDLEDLEGLRADSTDEEIDALVAKMQAAADRRGVTLTGDLRSEVEACRDALILRDAVRRC